MTWFLLIPFLIYCLFILLIWIGVRRTNCPELTTDTLPSFSIIVAARDEENNLKETLEGLLVSNDSYPDFEIIIVDDHSTDKTAEVIRDIGKADSRVKYIIAENQGKKNAISQGVGISKGEWIAVTDADCLVPDKWLLNVGSRIKSDDHMLLGIIKLNAHTVNERIQQMEQAALIGVGMGLLKLGKPSMANAANMFFRKSTFLEVNGYEENIHIPSGDDEFLMKSIYNKYRKGVRYLNCGDIVVSTNAESKITSFINQRKRWASKWKHQDQSWVGVAVFLFYMFLIWSIGFSIAFQAWWILIGLISKAAVDYLLMTEILNKSKVRISWIAFIAGQILYPFYAILIGILANFGTYSWKGRKYKSG